MSLTSGLAFTKGHGTENDFVILPDVDGSLDLTETLVAALCDRRSGIGADGVLRVVRADAVPGLDLPLGGAEEVPEWFMDYRNADGSLAEMCGNGVRVYVAYLLRAGLVELPPGRSLPLATRAGVKQVRREGAGFVADLGPFTFPGGEKAVSAGYDALVRVGGLDGVPRPALSLELGNAHTVVALAGQAELERADLSAPPVVDPAPPHGTNVELVVPLEVRGVEGHLRMRVHERGVGETRSCGTGACAAALAARAWAGPGAPDDWRVEVPGGTLRVRVVDGVRVELAGPAELVADGVLDGDWLSRHASVVEAGGAAGRAASALQLGHR